MVHVARSVLSRRRAECLHRSTLLADEFFRGLAGVLRGAQVVRISDRNAETHSARESRLLGLSFVPPDRLGILGAGRQALETSQYCRELGLHPAFFLEEGAPPYSRDERDYGAPILRFDDDLRRLLGTPVVSAVGHPSVRRRLLDRWPSSRFSTVISRQAWLAADAVVGEGSTVAPLAALNRRVVVGKHVLVNVGSILSHDVVVGDLSTLSPRSAIGGGSVIDPEVFVGIGATIIDQIKIGRGAIVGAGAVVVHDVEMHTTVVGVPARPVNRHER